MGWPDDAESLLAAPRGRRLCWALVDETGGVSLVFFGRRHIDGVDIGTTMRVTGMAIEHRGRLAIVNPVYELS